MKITSNYDLEETIQKKDLAKQTGTAKFKNMPKADDRLEETVDKSAEQLSELSVIVNKLHENDCKLRTDRDICLDRLRFSPITENRVIGQIAVK